MRPKVSTRLAIALQSLEDSEARLGDMPDSEQVTELRRLLAEAQSRVRAWMSAEPPELARAELVRYVLNLHLVIMELGRAR